MKEHKKNGKMTLLMTIKVTMTIMFALTYSMTSKVMVSF